MVLYQYDALMEQHLGEMGLYQLFLATLCSLDAISYACYTLMPVFIASTPPHLCAPPVPPGINCTLQEYYTWAAPLTCTPEGECSPDPCRMYKMNVSMAVSNCSDGLLFDMVDVRETEACTHWSYGDSFYPDNAVREWDLVCGRKGAANTISGVYMLGRMFGCLAVGCVADAIGRRKTMLIVTVLTFGCAIASALVPNYYAFLVFRFLVATFDMARSNVDFILGVEFLHTSRRAFFVGYWSFFWVLGSVSLAGLAYFIQNWRYLHIASAIPEIPLFIILYLCLPESPRWLLLRGRKSETKKFIEKMAKVNGKTLPEDWEIEAEKEYATKESFIDLLKAPRMRLMTFIMAFIFFANSFVYYGLTLNTSSLAGNKYLNFLISGAIEFPSYALIAFCYERVARRPPFCLCLMAGGILLLSTLLVPKDVGWLVVVLSMAGKFFITASFIIVWLVVSELFPTAVRGAGLGFTNSAARFASFLSAYVTLLMAVHLALPAIIFSISAILAGFLVLVIPETKGMSLIQTVQEGEVFIKANMCKMGFCKRKETSNEKEGMPMENPKEVNV